MNAIVIKNGLICKETSEHWGLTEGNEYKVGTNGQYRTFTNDNGIATALTKESFDLYFGKEKIK